MADNEFNLTTTRSNPMSKEPEQAKLLRSARKTLGITSAELADRLGVSLPALNSWLLPKGAKASREMPQTARLLLRYVLLEHRRAKAR